MPGVTEPPSLLVLLTRASWGDSLSWELSCLRSSESGPSLSKMFLLGEVSSSDRGCDPRRRNTEGDLEDGASSCLTGSLLGGPNLEETILLDFESISSIEGGLTVLSLVGVSFLTSLGTIAVSSSLISDYSLDFGEVIVLTCLRIFNMSPIAVTLRSL